jgi:hypothetical protein
LLSGLAEHVAGGEVNDVQVVHQPLALRAFADAGRTDED